MNMSYCRFQNTLLDLQDCFGALEELQDIDLDKLDVDDERNLSKEEFEAANNLLELCGDMIESFDRLEGEFKR